MSTTPRISMIAAIGAHDRAIGKDNQLLWHIKDDMKRLRMLTTHHTLIMGRKTYESVGHPLPNRANIVISRDPDFQALGCIVVTSLEEAFVEAKKYEREEVFIFGGAQIYAHALPHVDRLYITLIYDEKVADTFFPEYKSEFTKEIFREEGVTPEGLHYTWINLER